MFVDSDRNELNLKILYCGPRLAGRATNLKYIHDKTDRAHKSALIAYSMPTSSHLGFDFLTPIAPVRGLRTRLHLFTGVSDLYFDEDPDAHEHILSGVDGIVFVADSQPGQFEANSEVMSNLAVYLEQQGYEDGACPFVFQYNKQDLADAVSVEALRLELNPRGCPEHGAVATNGIGVFDTLKDVGKLALAAALSRLD